MNNQLAWLPEPEVSKIPWPTELTFLEKIIVENGRNPQSSFQPN